MAYDNLGRLTGRTMPGSEPNATYSYDLAGRLTGAVQDGRTLAFAYDALGRMTSASGPHGALTYQHDAAGRRTRITHPDAFYVTYDYDVIGNVTAIRENGATSGVGVLATYAYDALGRRSSVTYGNGTVQTLTFDGASRLTGLSNGLAGTAHDLSQTFSYNPAGQIGQAVRSNDAYAWTGHYTIDRLYTADGLNRLTGAGSVSLGYDARGNLTSSGASSYGYNADNMLTTAPGGTSLAWDPAGRLAQTVGGGVTTRFAYDGVNLVAEYNASNVMQRRYVHGPGTDEPIVWYEGSGTSDRRFLMADERGSIVSVTNGAGAVLAINAYDEYGIPGSGNMGRFQYTGQTWLPEVGLYHYKARMYSPTLGRFMQTDPIGYADGMNWYAYARNDPVNYRDPTGMWGDDIIVTANLYPNAICANGDCGSVMMDLQKTFQQIAGMSGGGGGGGWPDIVVTASLSALCHNNPNHAACKIQSEESEDPWYCQLGNIGIGLGGDAYYGGGVSLSGRISIDPARGRFSIGGSGGVGIGSGGGAGWLLYRSSPFSSGAGVLQVGAATCVGGGFLVGGSHCETYAGSDGNSGQAATVSLVRAGAWSIPVSPDVSLVTPSLWNLGCKK